MIFAGEPATIEYAGISVVTTELQAMIAPLPICTFGRIIAPSPIHTLSSIKTSPLEKSKRFDGAVSNNSNFVSPCALSVIRTLGPVSTLLPIVTLFIAVIWD